MTKRCCLLVSILHLILFLCCTRKTTARNNSRLLIISLDGFRHQYLNTYSLPTINSLRNEGVQTTHGMQPTFVTMTYPNHISIATGMYQEDHGIVHNQFFDTKLQKYITFGTRDEGQWSDVRVEPLWITATKQNKNSGVLYWPAGHNEFHGIRPLIYTSLYSDSIPLREKIDNAIDYFRRLPIQLVMLYHNEPDKQGHMYGPDSRETYQALLNLDQNLTYLLTKVKNELAGDLNIIILSDHGMTNTTRTVRPFLEGYLNKSAVETYILDGPLFSVTPLSGKLEEVLSGLRRIPNVTVYTRDQFPERYHYSKAIYRIDEIIVVPNDEGTMFSQATTPITSSPGNHGYDNTLPSMQAIFLAHGPDFSQHTTIPSLKNVDVYHIACKILDLIPNPYATAGSLTNLTSIFRTNYTNKCSRAFLDLLVIAFVFLSKFLLDESE